MVKKTPPPNDSFRVPNSIIQGVTTQTATDLNRLRPFDMVTLLGLLAAVPDKHPHKEVRLRLSQILEIIEVGKNVAHTVDREWVGNGEQQTKRYKTRRFSPTHRSEIHKAMLSLHNESVVIRRYVKKNQQREERIVHVLDMFGYRYVHDGEAVDVDNLPEEFQKINVGTENRPVWRLRRRTNRGTWCDRPSEIVFRLNKDLAEELAKKRGSLGFTLLARKIFGLLRQHIRSPAAIRLIMLIARQTAPEFTRRSLRQVMGELGFNTEHPARGLAHLNETLAQLREAGFIESFCADQAGDRLTIQRNSDWYRDREATA